MWKVSFDPGRQLLLLRLTEHVDTLQMRKLAGAHARALEATGGRTFRVMIDLRGLHPMEEEAVALFSSVKRVAAATSGYSGCAILTDSPTVAMQQHRTRVDADASEMITMDEDDVLRFVDSG